MHMIMDKTDSNLRRGSTPSDEKHSKSSHESDLDKFPMDLVSDGQKQSPNGESRLTDKDTEYTPGQDHVDHNINDDSEEFSTSNLNDSKNDTVEIHKSTVGRCALCRAACALKCLECCRPALTQYNPLPHNPKICDKVRYGFMCPPHGKIGRALMYTLCGMFFYGSLWGITGAEALPGGSFFGLCVLFVCCLLGGALVEKMRLPALLGMLLVGGILRNVPYINVAKDIDPVWSGALRSMALVVILIRAGMGLDPKALMKLSFGVIRLAFLPCLAETVTAAVASHLLLGFPWIWGFMLGFVLAAVSPAVVVPTMLTLVQKGYGVDKGIPTLVIAAASVDDVLAISGFGVVLGIAFSKGDLAVTIIKGPLEAVAGIVYGILFGVIAWYLPPRKHSHKTLFRFILLLCGGLLAQFGSRRADLAGAGALGCLTLAFVAALMWRKDVQPGLDMPMEKLFAALWIVFQPLLFGLIGAEVDVLKIDPKTIGLGIAVLAIGLTIRMIVSFLSVFKLDFTWKEMFFIPLAWLPKATVQAAIGSVALDTARATTPDNEENIKLGTQLLTIAVLVILITAPLGAIAITLSAPRLLKKTTEPFSEVSVEPLDSMNGNLLMEQDHKPDEETTSM